MVNKFRIDRRTHLKGLGAALALPLLETMGWAESGRGKHVKPPVRLGFMYMPHGVIMDQFWPASAESFLSAPPPALESLRPVLNQCLLMKGISGVPVTAVKISVYAITGLVSAIAGVVPIENLVNGTVRENYDLLADADLRILQLTLQEEKRLLDLIPRQRGETGFGSSGRN